MAPATPQAMARRRRCGGRLRQASAITSALSAPSTTSRATICANPAQNGEYSRTICMGRATGPDREAAGHYNFPSMPASSLPPAITRVRRALLALALALGALPAVAATALEATLPAVRYAALRGNLAAVAASRTQFAGHPLEAYPHFWALTATLERADPSEVRDFLARHAATPLAETLRREWL